MHIHQGESDMSLLLTTIIMLAFAGVYALLLAMLGSRTSDLRTALLGRPLRLQVDDTGLVASRRLSLA